MKDLKILIIGGTGMLGHKLVQVLKNRFDVYTTIRRDLRQVERFNIFEKQKTFENIDIENRDAVKNIIRSLRPDFVINAVGIIKQIENSKNVIETLSVNAIFPHRLAEYAGESGAKLITVGTDCVFRGDKGNYIEEDLSDAVDLYGKSKNLGEVAADHCLTIRTSIIGREIESAHSLAEWFLSNRGGRVKGFRKAIYSGFPTIVFAEVIADLIENHPHLRGLYHVSSEPINKYELLKLINEKYRAGIETEPDEEFTIDRSLNSDMFRRETGFEPPEWETMIERMAGDVTPYDEWRK